VNGLARLEEYLEFMRTHAGEAGALLQDLLISVTNFFRDRECFDALRSGLPELFADKAAGDAVRVWVPACATGEEAYSLGMLLMEYAATLDAPPTIQIFATDLDESVIAAARDALYPATIAADVSEERLRRFFTKEHRGYRVRRELRECVLFAAHDLLRDAPFSRLDLVSCRNLLIYLTAEAQKRATEIFHFALRPHATLFLGSSEAIDEHSALFTPLDKKHRLYRQLPITRGGVPVPVGPGTIARAIEAQERARSGPVVHGAGFARMAAISAEHGAVLEGMRAVSWEELHFKLIERFAPPSLIVTREYDIVHISENAGRFLHFSSGEPSVNLLRVVHPMLRVELRAALFRAAQTSTPVEVFRVPVEIEGESISVDLRVAPAQEIAPDYLLVVLSSRGKISGEEKPVQLEAEPAVRHLEREIEQMKSRLRDTIERYEVSTEELKASNEELQAMNEELRSATEELETSREELQSINEEVTTVNQELKSKVDQLGQSNSDLANLMAATAIATMFLDRTLHIMRYTPAVADLFRLIPSDIGRPLTDLTHRLNYPELKTDTERVLQTLVPIVREVPDGAGRWYLARLLPYRTTEDQIAGAVLTFVDITESRRAALALHEAEERMRFATEAANIYGWEIDPATAQTRYAGNAERVLGFALPENRPEMLAFIHPDDRAAVAEKLAAAMEEKGRFDMQFRLLHPQTREVVWQSSQGLFLPRADGTARFVGIAQNITARKQAEDALEKSLQETERARAEAEAAGRAKDHFLAVLSHELRTPLTPIMMIVDTLARRTDLPAPAVEALATIRRNVEIESHFIEDLLDVTRIGRGKFEIARQPVDLHEAIRHAIAITESDLRAKAQHLSVELQAAEHVVAGDSTRLQQVVWNLLKNASKFTPRDGEIHLRTSSESGHFAVAISDNGIGIAAEALPHIFDAFAQASAAITREYGGLGLGLAIAQATIAAHGGELRAESAGLGRGAIFTATLPLARA
jgi:two-component system CheB/CheR fusion protein